MVASKIKKLSNYKTIKPTQGFYLFYFSLMNSQNTNLFSNTFTVEISFSNSLVLKKWLTPFISKVALNMTNNIV